MNKITKSVVLFLVLSILTAVYAIYAGFVLSALWGWFIVSTFALPGLSIPVAIGINYIVRMIIIDTDYNEDIEDSSAILKQSILSIIVKPTTFLTVGWIVAQFV